MKYTQKTGSAQYTPETFKGRSDQEKKFKDTVRMIHDTEMAAA
jgi:hypothetical protein